MLITPQPPRDHLGGHCEAAFGARICAAAHYYGASSGGSDACGLGDTPSGFGAGGGLWSSPQSTIHASMSTSRAPIRYSRSSSSASSTGLSNSSGNASQMVAIDSKIEQAMDLVKTHLMFAVREEVEVLRGRILELESSVCQLEAENIVLRKHVSEDILNKLNLN